MYLLLDFSIQIDLRMKRTLTKLTSNLVTYINEVFKINEIFVLVIIRIIYKIVLLTHTLY